jgi:alcohol dehydrogenase (cytochrome c)
MMHLRKLRSRWRSYGVAAAACIGLTAITIDADAQSARERTRGIERAPAFNAQALTALPGANWPTNGGDVFNRRFSALDQINRNNVQALKGVWRTRLGGSGLGPRYSGEAQPIVYDGVVYVITGADDVFAIRVETGEILWSYQAQLNDEISTVCCGWTSRGVGLGDGKVFVGQLDGKLVALDQRTGAVRWSTQAEAWQDGYTITSAPLYYDGLVITGFAGAEFATRGRVKAFDADDGELVWTFYPIPGPGEPGHDTGPPDNDLWMHGGGSVWQTPAVDPELGLIYFSTGNPGPDLNGAVRAGDNLYTASIVAIEARTGRYRWHFQQVHHDLWDFDSSNPVVLFDVVIDGVERKGLAEVSKAGWAYILDRITGEPLLGIDEQPVAQEPRQLTSPTQPIPRGDPIGPRTLDFTVEGFELTGDGHVFTPFWTEPVLAKRLGANWPPSAYDPRTQTLFVCANERTFYYSVNAQESDDPTTGTRYMGGSFGNAELPPLGLLAAMDMKTNRAVWRQRWADRCFSGITATAGGLLFVGRNDGRLTALDSSNGAKLWEFQTGAGVNAPASVFEHEGEQYVVVLSAGNLFVGTPRGDSVWLFGLSGTLEEALPPSVGLTLTTPTDAEGAESLFAQACQFCHGSDGAGAEGGIDLRTSTLTRTRDIARVIMSGQNQMPPFAAMLSDEQVAALAAYVLELKAQ